jgi:hypothetical protein
MLTSTVMNVCFLLFAFFALLFLRGIVGLLKDIYERLGFIVNTLASK